MDSYLYRGLKTEFVFGEMYKFGKKNKEKLYRYEIAEVIQMLENPDEMRRRKFFLVNVKE